MANTFQLLSYANTFDNWVVLTNQQAIELNALGKNDWTKDSGILILNGTPTSLQANNQAIFSGPVQITGTGSSLYVQNSLTVDRQINLTNTILSLVTNGQANINGRLVAQGPNTGLFVANTANIGGALNVNGISTFNNNITLSSFANLIFSDGSIQTSAAASNVRTDASFNQANSAQNLAQAAYNQANVTVGVDATQNVRIQAVFDTVNASAILSSNNTFNGNQNFNGTVNLNSNVNLGISASNTTTINSQLSANGSVGNNRQIFASRGSNLSPEWISLIQGSGITIDSSANGLTIGIGQSVNTTSAIQFGSLGVGTVASGTTGEIRAINNITAYFSSDLRLKENINPIQNPIEKIKKIRGVTFNWTQDYINNQGGEDGYFIRKNDVGLIAQEVESVLPEIVVDRKDGFKAIKYDRLVALLVEAIKELSEEIDKLKNEK